MTGPDRQPGDKDRDDRRDDYRRGEYRNEELDRFTREAGEGLSRMVGQFLEGQIRDKAFGPGGFGGSQSRPQRRPAAPDRTDERRRDSDDGVGAIVRDTGDGVRVEQVFASEIDALRANQYNVDADRSVALLPYGTPLTDDA